MCSILCVVDEVASSVVLMGHQSIQQWPPQIVRSICLKDVRYIHMLVKCRGGRGRCRGD